MTSCFSDATGGGHRYTVLNESSRDVLVELITDKRAMYRVPGHTRAYLSESRTYPTDQWRVVVRDETCTELGTFGLEGRQLVTVHVSVTGQPELGPPSLFNQDGDDDTFLESLAPGRCG